MDLKQTLWTEKYRPEKIANYVFSDTKSKNQIEQWIANRDIPHILFHGSPGTGKTTLALILVNELDIDPYDVLFINASRENSIDDMRNKITSFVSTLPFGRMKVVILDECDGLSQQAQGPLRGIMEQYAVSSRFILTCVTGDTKVYTPFGSLRIDQVGTQDLYQNSNKFRPVSSIVKSANSELIKISTLHGKHISVTKNHKFFTLGGEITAANMKKGDNILINLKAMYGNSYDYKAEDTDNFFDLCGFIQLLKIKGHQHRKTIDFLNSHSHFLFSPDIQETVDFLNENNITQIHVPSLSEKLGKTKAHVFNLLKKIDAYVMERKYISVNHLIYTIDWCRFNNDYQKFLGQVEEWSLCGNLYELWRTRGHHHTIEEIVDSLNISFDLDKILSMGRLIGFMAGDGHISNRGMIHCAADNDATLAKILMDINKFLQKPQEYKPKQNGKDTKGRCIAFTNRSLAYLLEYMGAFVGNKVNTVQVLPRHCFTYQLFFKGYIQALIDSDGAWPILDKNEKTTGNICLRQHHLVLDHQNDMYKDIVFLLKKFFDIDSYCRNNIKVAESSFWDGTTRRFEKRLYISGTDNIYKYLLKVGSYYDKVPLYDLLGYLSYRREISGTYKFLTFYQWKQIYYCDGYINDSITNIEQVFSGDSYVYDAAFSEYHWYVTNGFISHNCNYPNKIIPAIHSRCQSIQINKLDLTEFTARIAEILLTETIEFDMDTLDDYVRASWPDMRKCINLCHQNSVDGHLMGSTIHDSSSRDYRIDAIALFKQGKFREARELIGKQIRPEELDDFFRFLYDNLDLWGKTPEQKDSAILIIRKGLVQIPLVADAEILVSAVITELLQNL